MEPESDLEDEELRLETDGIGESLARFREESERSPLAASSGGADLLRIAHPPLTEAILRDQGRIRRGWKPRHWKAMVGLPADKQALIALTGILNAIGEVGDDPDGVTVTMVAGRVGYGCMRERRGDLRRGRALSVAEVGAARNKRPSQARKRGRDHEKDLDQTDWKVTYLDIHLGAALLDLALKHSGILEEHKNLKSATTIHLTSQAIARYLERQNAKESSIRPAFLPMVIPPRPWKAGAGGGYLALELGMVKRGEAAIEQAMSRADLRVPSEALNAVQETPWRLHARIAALFRTAWERKEPRGVLPPTDLVEIPPLPSRKSTDPETYALLRDEYEEARRRSARVLSQHVLMETRLAVCELFAGRDPFYFPAQLDHRGRAYAVPQVVHPQADDYARALLEFSRGKPLGERGAYWLAVHLANLFAQDGVDKLPFDGRVRWVEENREAILDSANRPLEGARFWTKAEKPWRFLAGAFEWAGYVREGPGFVSRQAVAMDATANGLQHLSALGRDPEGGRHTNLLPASRPADIYRVVAEELEKMVNDAAARGEKKAREWQGAIDRKLLKQPTMTTPYGITVDGMVSQILDSIGEREDGRFKSPWKAASYLAPLVGEAIARVVVKASEISRWLQAIAGRLATLGRSGVRWHVPTGFPVVHERWNERVQRVSTVRWTLQLREPDPRLGINAVDQVNGIVAHVIHSLDADHMMETALAFRREGLADFAMVHDSFAVHAPDVDLMHRILRETFIQLHQDFTLATLLREMRKWAPAKVELPEPPPVGALDLAQVRNSAYFFS